MVNLHKKNLIFIFIFILLLLFTFYVLLYNDEQRKIDELSNQFYTKHHVALLDSEKQPHWPISSVKNLEYRTFIEYDSTFRFFIQKNGSWQPPMHSGRFFLNDEKGKKAVVGREMQNYITEKNNERYINFNGEDYLVIGIVGDSFVSHADYLILLSSSHLPEALNSRIIIDSDEAPVVKEVTKSLMAHHKSISRAEVKERGTTKSANSHNFNLLFLLNSMFLIICTLFFSLRYWYEIEKNRVYVYFLLGISRKTINFILLKELFFTILIASFLSIIIFYFIQPQFFINSYSEILFIIFLVIIISICLLTVFLFGELRLRKRGSVI